MPTFVPPDPTQPPDSGFISAGAAAIRAINAYLASFLAVSFDLTTGKILASAVPNGLPTPYGTAGQILVSTGAGTAPVWATPGNLIPGMICPYGGSSAPSGWLICDGTTKVIATYPALAAILGTTFGGDGVTTFGLPDLRGRTPVGLGTGDGGGATNWTLGRKLGEETHLINGSTEMPAHVHSVAWAAAGQWQNGPQPVGQAVVSPAIGATNTSSVGGTTPMNVTQPSLGLNMIIKT